MNKLTISSKNRKRLISKIVAFFVVIIVGLSTATTAYAQASVSAGLFRKGSVRLSLFIGSGSAFNDTYTILGVGGGYYIVDGLELGLDVESWLGGDPDINRVSPQVRYVFYSLQTIKPYVGVFYRRTFIEQFEDLDTAGVRGGLYFVMGRRAYFGVGVVYDVYLDCEKSTYTTCSDTYPEFLFAITF